MKDTVWVLTREINEYYQEGEYFVHAWKTKPTIDQLSDVLPKGFVSEQLRHILFVGGRSGEEENEWYYLREVEC